MWDAVAPSWGAHADYVDRRGAPVGEAMLDRAGVRAGDVVLELACGPGGCGRAAAARVAPSGRVVLSDVASPMVATALARAAEDGLGNVEGRVLDLEAIAEPDGAYDVVLCREGLMFAVDPARAAREMHRVLRPGGRVAVAVWASRERNPWLGTVLDVVGAHVGHRVPPPGVPGPFALGDAGVLEGVVSGAGLVDVAVEEREVRLEAASADEWWERTTALAGPLSALIERMGADERAALRRRAHRAVGPWESGGKMCLPGVSLVATARRPGAV